MFGWSIKRWEIENGEGYKKVRDKRDFSFPKLKYLLVWLKRKMINRKCNLYKFTHTSIT